MAAKQRGVWVVGDFEVLLSAQPAWREGAEGSKPIQNGAALDLLRRSLAGEDVSAEMEDLLLSAESQRVVERHFVAETVRTAKYARRVKGARVFDEGNGVTYECTAERRNGVPVLTFLSVIPHFGAPIESRHMESIPLRELAEATLIHVEGGRPVSYARASRHQRPSNEQVARDARTAIGSGQSARIYIATKYQRQPSTADKWLRAARDAGALETMGIGRPRVNRSDQHQEKKEG